MNLGPQMANISMNNQMANFNGFGKRGHTDRQTDRQNSCFISIDI